MKITLLLCILSFSFSSITFESTPYSNSPHPLVIEKRIEQIRLKYPPTLEGSLRLWKNYKKLSK